MKNTTGLVRKLFVADYPLEFDNSRWILTVDTNGSVNLLKNSLDLDKFLNKGSKNAVSYNFTGPVIPVDKYFDVKCLDIIELTKDQSGLKFSFYSNPNCILVVHGVIINKIESIAIYSVLPTGLKMVHFENRFGVNDLCYLNDYGLVCSIPKSLGGCIMMHNLVIEEDDKLEPVYYPDFSISLYNTERFNHMNCSRKGDNIVLWTDDVLPYFAFYSVKPDKTYIVDVYKFTVEAFIREFVVHENGCHYGVVMETDDKCFVCIWNRNSNRINQKNYEFNNLLHCENYTSSYLNAYFSRNECNELCFVVSTHKFLCEATLKSLTVFDANSYRGTMLKTKHDNLFISFSKCNFSLINKQILERERQSSLYYTKTSSKTSFENIKANCKGKTMNAEALCMKRCYCCRRSLLYHLLSEKDGIYAYYCSKECQKKHWPTFFEASTSKSL